jgi:hypothetical protein
MRAQEREHEVAVFHTLGYLSTPIITHTYTLVVDPYGKAVLLEIALDFIYNGGIFIVSVAEKKMLSLTFLGYVIKLMLAVLTYMQALFLAVIDIFRRTSRT